MATNYQKYTCVGTGDGSLVTIHITNFTYSSHYQIYTHAELVIKLVTHVNKSRNVSTNYGCENCGATKIALSHAAWKIVVPQKSEREKLTIIRTGDGPAT